MFKKLFKIFLQSDNAVSRFSVKLLRDYRVKVFNKKDFKTLEISGGSAPLSREYLNVDVSVAPEVDVVTNLLEPLPFGDAYCKKIVSVATLEHFSLTDVRIILQEFYRVLSPGGELHIGVPSLAKIIDQYKEKGCNDEVLRYLHGGLKDKYDIHLFVVDAKRFIDELLKIGFFDVKEVEYDFPRHNKNFMMKIVAKK